MGATLGIIGGGNMGGAIVGGAIEARVLAPQDVVVAEIDPARRAEMAGRGCAVSDDPKAVLSCEQIMLAVKPQSFAGVADAIAPLPEARVVISIMAGLDSVTIRRALGPARVVRVMPNTPCRIGVGMTAIALGAGAQGGDEALAVAIFEALGAVAMIDEKQMHAVTGISGSGPAYLYLLAEAMERAAAGAGLDESTAALLVRQTMLGAGRLLAESGEDPAALREAVTSPGGTTEAALEVMLKRDLPGIVVEAIAAARQRGVDLDKE